MKSGVSVLRGTIGAIDRFAERSRWARRVGMLTSAALAGLLIAVGLAVVPGGGAGGETRDYQVAGAAPDRAGWDRIPVFVMDENRRIVRNAAARATADGVVQITFYEKGVLTVPTATEAMLFEPGLSVLWAAAPDTAREALLARVAVVQDAAAQTAEAILTSKVMADGYRPILRDILADAVSAAWRDDRTEAAMAALVVRAEPAVARAMEGDARIILRDHLERAVWEMVRANWKTVLGTFMGYELDYAPVSSTIATAFRDPRVQDIVMRLGTELLETPEAGRLCERLAIEIVDRLIRDPRLPLVVGRIVSDPALRAEVQPLSQAVLALVESLPRTVQGIGGQSDLNPLVAHVFKALTLAERTPLIMFVTPKDRQRIEMMDSDAVHRIRPVGAGAPA